MAKAKMSEKSIQQIESQAAKNIVNLRSKLQAKKLKSALVRNGEPKERRTKKSAVIDKENKDRTKENWVENNVDNVGVGTQI